MGTSEKRAMETEQEMEVLGVSWGLVQEIRMQTWTKIPFLQNADLVWKPLEKQITIQSVNFVLSISEGSTF